MKLIIFLSCVICFCIGVAVGDRWGDQKIIDASDWKIENEMPGTTTGTENISPIKIKKLYILTHYDTETLENCNIIYDNNKGLLVYSDMKKAVIVER